MRSTLAPLRSEAQVTESKDGFSTKEILVEIRDDLKDHIKESEAYAKDVQAQLARRPKRSEIIGWATSVGIVVGAVVAVLP